MALDDAELAATLKAAFISKLSENVGSDFTSLSADFKNKFLGSISEAVAESINEHIRTRAEVKVVIVGLDTGASLPAPLLTTLAARGSTPPFVPDSGLQTEIPLSGTPVPTTPSVTSSVLSVPAVIE